MDPSGFSSERPHVRPIMPECAKHPSSCASWSGTVEGYHYSWDLIKDSETTHLGDIYYYTFLSTGPVINWGGASGPSQSGMGGPGEGSRGANDGRDGAREDSEPPEAPQTQPCTGIAGAVQDFTGGDNGQGWGEWWDSTKPNYSDTMGFDVASIGDYGVGLDTPIAMGTAPFVAQTWGGITPGQALSQVVAAARATIKTPGLIGFRTPLQLTATVGASWLWNAAVAKVSYRVGVAAGSGLRAGANQVATYACSKQD